MARPLRLEFSGALYQITSRGNRQESIYESDIDREKFAGSMLDKIDADKTLSEIPVSQRRAVPKALSYYAKKHAQRNEAIVYAYASGGYSFKEVGNYFELHYSTVSGIIKNHKSKS